METRTTKIKRRLEKGGWYLARHGSSHDIYRHQDIRGIITLPRHRTVSPRVARSIASKAQWRDDE
ncbi:MAG: type II toxin-antitoxin system HicA family toxin [Gammaproteobacteria bacterium]|nr:type II toxin-antitoxin system HicA family toxin [Gammaproteobacteria bacterium]MDE0248934.1 type II toxin-antitoxin system HicA family toxin [Gammaproteobacteria bacterium]